MPEEEYDEAEEIFEKALNVELREHIRLCHWALRVDKKVRASLPDMPLDQVSPSSAVSSILIARLCNDLRCVMILARKGYAVQAASQAASMLEAAWTVVAIGTDDAKAQNWLGHSEPTKPFLPVKKLITAGLENLGAIPQGESRCTQADTEYRIYRQLCLAKHANPLFQQRHGVHIARQSITAFCGPDCSNESIRTCQFALENTPYFLFLALSSFVVGHVSDLVRDDLLRDLERVGAERKRLEAKSKERWGTEDPFPGKW